MELVFQPAQTQKKRTEKQSGCSSHTIKMMASHRASLFRLTWRGGRGEKDISEERIGSQCTVFKPPNWHIQLDLRGPILLQEVGNVTLPKKKNPFPFDSTCRKNSYTRSPIPSSTCCKPRVDYLKDGVIRAFAHRPLNGLIHTNKGQGKWKGICLIHTQTQLRVHLGGVF